MYNGHDKYDYHDLHGRSMGASKFSEGEHLISGFIQGRGGLRRGYAEVVDGKVVRFGNGDPGASDMHAVMVPGVVNGHTHCADYGLKIPKGLTLEQLVAPPDGLKHRYLREAGKGQLISDMRSFSEDSRTFGTELFVDFREGGVEGCRMLREASPDALILGRPVSPEFDPEEIGSILDVADGIGISSISDMPMDYIEQVADEVRSRNSIFAVHVSERVREDIDAVLSLDPAFIVHMCEATDDDLLKCAEAEVPIVVCPSSNSYFGKVPPVARMQSCGVDIALGTDNGMLAAPDMAREASRLLAALESQGGDPGTVWYTLVCLKGKLLYRQKQIEHPTNPGRMMVIPLEMDDDPLSGLRDYDGGAFGLDVERG